ILDDHVDKRAADTLTAQLISNFCTVYNQVAVVIHFIRDVGFRVQFILTYEKHILAFFNIYVHSSHLLLNTYILYITLFKTYKHMTINCHVLLFYLRDLGFPNISLKMTPFTTAFLSNIKSLEENAFSFFL